MAAMNKYRLQDISSVYGGGTPDTKNASYWNGSIPWITPKDMSLDDSLFIGSGERYITDKGIANSSAKLLPEGSVIFSSRAPIGYCSIAECPLATSQGCKGIICDDSIINNIYLCFVLRMAKDQLNTMSVGSTFKEISTGELKNIVIQVPSIEKQHTISTLLVSIENSIVTCDQIKACLEKTIELIYNYWFVQFDFPDENGRPYKSSGGKMVYNEQLKREIPEGWSPLRLTESLRFERGTEVGSKNYQDKPQSQQSVKFYRVRDVENDSSTYVDKNNNRLNIVKPGDVIVTFDGSVGKVGINVNGAISSGLRHIYDPNNKISNSFIWCIFRSSRIQEQLNQYVSGRGSILAHASGAIDDLYIPFSEDIVNQFQKIINPMYELIINNMQQSQQLAQLRDWLLPMLMNGQVTIGGGDHEN